MKKELQDCMTSELLFQSMQADTSDLDKDYYLAEYEKRLRMIGLTDEELVEFRKADEFAINNGCYIKSDVLLSSIPLIKAQMKGDSIKLENCTFSELIYLAEDANFVYRHDKHLMDTEIGRIIFENALDIGLCLSARVNHNRMKTIGLTDLQESIFVRNERKIIQRLRWHHTEELAWC